MFRYVTLPLLKPTTVYVLTISIYAGLAMFLESYMLWAGNNSPNNIGLTIVGYLYKRGIEKNDMGYACAVGVVPRPSAAVIIFICPVEYSVNISRNNVPEINTEVNAGI